ncbi:hypothetical protein A3725_36595 [Alcanivorax sp. HI0035]|nr:hypothetical protein A3725_36595 [Alcanivorax sp. HI0035]
MAAGRGVAALPNWALTEYTEHDLLKTVRLGEKGVWRTLYAAVRVEDHHTPYMQEFWETAKELCFKTLSGVRAVKGS